MTGTQEADPRPHLILALMAAFLASFSCSVSLFLCAVTSAGLEIQIFTLEHTAAATAGDRSIIFTWKIYLMQASGDVNAKNCAAESLEMKTASVQSQMLIYKKYLFAVFTLSRGALLLTE